MTEKKLFVIIGIVLLFGILVLSFSAIKLSNIKKEIDLTNLKNIQLQNQLSLGGGGSAYIYPGEIPQSASTTAATANVIQQLASSTAVKNLTMRACPSNTGNIIITTSTSAATSTQMGLTLEPGDAIGLDISDLNKIYFFGTANNSCVNYWGSY